LKYTPDPNYSVIIKDQIVKPYEHFTMDAPFFFLDESRLPALYDSETNPDSIIDGYEVTSTRLIIHLRDGLNAMQTDEGLFYFDFNPDYLKKVPSQTPLWSLAPEIWQKDEFDEKDRVFTPSSKVEVTSNNETYPPSVGVNKRTPSGDDYSNGGIVAKLSSGFDTSYLSLDPEFSSYTYFDVPKGTVLGSNFSETMKSNFIEDFNDSGYTRYYVYDTSTVFSNNNYSLVPPDMNVDTKFDIRVGIVVKRINEAPIEIEKVLSYKKTDLHIWKFNMGASHVVTVGQTTMVNHVEDSKMSEDGGEAVSPYTAYLGGSIFATGTAIANTGELPITGVNLVLYQAEEGVPKVNFSQIRITALRDSSDSSNLPDWTQYRVIFNIKSAIGEDDRNGVEGLFTSTAKGVDNTKYAPSSTSTSGVLTSSLIALPTLAPGEYIDQIIITPYGTDGESEGILSVGNGFRIAYQTKSWPDELWPDLETTMGKYTAVPLGYKVFFNDESDGQFIEAASYEGDMMNVHYYRGAILAGAPSFFVKNPDTGANLTTLSVDSGELVTYNMSWNINTTETHDAWESPVGVARFPACMEITSLEDKDLIDPNGTHEGIVKIEKLSESDNNYTYYRFSIPGYTIPDANQYFSVPLEVKVKEGTAPATYTIGYQAGSSTDATHFFSLSSSYYDAAFAPNPAAYGFGEDDHWYRLNATARSNSTSLIVRSAAKMNTSTSVKGAGTGGNWMKYSSDDLAVPALIGETVRVKATINNTGNVGYNSLRFYAILPKVGDALATVGGSSVKFLDFEDLPPDATVYYYTGAQSIGAAQLPSYGGFGSDDPNLQSYSFSGWTTTKPANMNTVKAVRVVFNAATAINYGDELDITMLYEMDSDAAQTIKTQFRYSAKTTDAAKTTVNFNSDIATFSSETIALIYEENLPGNRVSDDLTTSLPENKTASGGTIASPFVVSATEPELDGYDFAGWNTAADGNGDSYAALAELPVIQTGSIVLYAQWTPKDVVIGYDLLGKDNYNIFGEISTFIPAPGSDLAKFGDVLTNPDNPLSHGYTFTGWYQVNPFDGLWEYENAAYFLGSIYDTSGHNYYATKTLYAGWTINEYTVKYDDNYSETDSIIATEVGKNIGNTVNIPGSSRPHYTFLGFSTDENANIPDVGFGRTDSDFTLDAAKIGSLFAKDTETEVILYAVWQDTYNIRFVSGTGAAASVATVWEDVEEGTLWSEAGTVPTPVSLDTHWINPVWSGALPEGSSQINANATYTLNYSLDSHTVTYEDTFHLNGTVPGADTKTHGQTVIIAGQGDLVHDGYTFLGWNEDPLADVATYAAGSNIIDIDANYTLHGIWEANDYALNFNANGGAIGSVATKQVTYDGMVGALPTDAPQIPTRAGYTFNGWSEISGTANTANFTSGNIVNWTEPKTVYAVWTANGLTPYTVEHYLVDGSGNSTKDDTTNHTAKTDTTANATPKTYEHYTLDTAHGSTVASGNVAGDGSLVLKLYYGVNRNNVSYQVTGVIPSGAPSAPSAINNVAYGTNVNVAGNLNFAGYTFSGWMSSQVSGSNFSMPDGNVVFTGNWTVIDYIIKYLPGEQGTFTAKSVTAHLGDNTPLAPLVTGKFGYDFIGWSPVLSTKVTGDATYVAQWKVVPVVDPPVVANTYTVSYIAGGDNVTGIPAMVYKLDANSNYTVSSDIPVRAGYTFAGWVSSLGGILQAGDVFTMPAADVVLTASWDSDTAVVTATNPGDGAAVVPEPKEPAATTGKAAVIKAARDAGIPILPGGVPLYSPRYFDTWSLIDLIFVVLGIILFATTVYNYRQRRKDEDRLAELYGYIDGEKSSKKKRLPLLLISIVFAISEIVIFVLTQDVNLPMVLVDKWTIVMAIVFAAEFVFASRANRGVKEDDDEYVEAAAI
jgi:uncharacterized repeat protein (TIGR02543 family)